MARRQWLADGCFFLIAAVIGSLLFAACSGTECGTSVHNFACSYYNNQLEEALISDKNELYWLHRTFFPEGHQSPQTVKISLKITVGFILLQNCTRNNQHPAYYFDGVQWVRTWNFTLSSSAVLALISEDVLFTFDNTFTWAIHTMATGLGAAISDGNILGIHVESLPCMPSQDIVTEVLTLQLSKLKMYARYQDKPPRWSEKDVQYISLGYINNKDGNSEIVLGNSQSSTILLLAAFVLMNLLAAVFLVLLTLECYPRLWKQVVSDRKNEQSLYLATVFVTFAANIMLAGVLVIAHIYQYPKLRACYQTQPDCNNTYVLITSIIRAFMTFSIALFHLLVSFKVCKSTADDKPTRITAIVFCCMCWWYYALKGLKGICTMSCSTHTRSQLVQSLSLFNIMLFLQHVCGAVVPICILLLIYPEQVLAAVLFISSAIFCIIIFTAHILHLDKHHKKNKVTKRLQTPLQALAVLLLVGILGVLGMLYLQLISQGIHTRGISGFLLTFLPSVTLMMLGIVVRKYFFRTQRTQQVEETS